MEDKITYKERIWWRGGSIETYTYYSDITSFTSLMNIYQRDIAANVIKIELFVIENNDWKPLLTFTRAKQEEYKNAK